jgi:putative hydrolase of the HAD superfamily
VIKAVMFDFGGVLTTSPFESFALYERERGLPDGVIRRLNSTNPDANAWARLERGEIDVAGFCELFEAEAAALGFELDAMGVLSCLEGRVRPEMLEAVRRCSESFKTACLTNNFGPVTGTGRSGVAEVYALFDAVLESSALGVRKPDPRFYEMACSSLDVEPAESVYLDDLGVNLKPAREMGMRTIKVTDARKALEELSAILGIELT